MFKAVFMCFSPYLGIGQGGGGGSPKGLVHNPLMQFFTRGQLRMGSFGKTFFWYRDHLK